MKTLHSLAALVLGTMMFASCDGFLDSDPITNLVESNFFKTEGDADLALIGCYDGLQMLWSDGVAFPVAQMVMSDECFGATGTGDNFDYQLMDEFDKSRSVSSLNIYNANWVLYYKGLYRCNMLLSKMDQIGWNSEAKRNQVEAEARFIRAYTYFEMVRLWGNVPLVTRPLSVSEANLPQADPDSVYQLIEEDLRFACENAPLKGEQWTAEWAAVNDGHATIYAAKALLARVFLFYTGFYGKETLPGGTTKAEVITHLQDAYNSGHSLVANFADLWPAACTVRSEADTLGLSTTYAGEGNSETVWAVKFNSSGNWVGNTDGFIGLKMIGLRNGQIKSFGNTCYGDGSWGGCSVVDRFVDEWDADEPGDPRRIASVMDLDAEGIVHTAGHSQREYTGYMNKKYTCLGNGNQHIYAIQSLDFQINEYQDFTVIRYADILLMLAELTEDASYLNEVRARAGLAPVTYSVENLRKERKYEFAFEAIRFSDLLRYDSTLEYAAAAVTYSGTVINGGGDPGTEKVIDGAKLKACRGFSQIPNTQIDLSTGVLKQNPGWE